MRPAIRLRGIANVDAVRQFERLGVPLIVQPVAPGAEAPRGKFIVEVIVAANKNRCESSRDARRRAEFRARKRAEQRQEVRVDG